MARAGLTSPLDLDLQDAWQQKASPSAKAPMATYGSDGAAVMRR